MDSRVDMDIRNKTKPSSNTLSVQSLSPKTSNKVKSKTVTKRSKSSDTLHSITQNTFNSNKRKLNEYNTNTNNNYKTEPNRKKRKYNDNTLNNKLTNLIEANDTYKKQNYDLQKQNIFYQKETNKWKSKYMKLYSKISEIYKMEAMNLETENDTNVINSNNKINTINGNNNKHAIETQSHSQTPPPTNFFYKQKSNNNTSSIIQTNNVNGNNNSKSKRISTRQKNKYDSIREQLFEMGFDKTEVVNRISLYNGSGKNPQFVFNQLINTFTSDLDKRPLRSNTKRNDSDSDESNTDGNDISNEPEYIPFDKSYYISVNCHVCNKHFDDIYKYRDHLKEHYSIDCTKEWLKCDFGCSFKGRMDNMRFIRHISTHTGDKPYHCNVIINGIKCDGTSGYKSNMRKHWKSHFKHTLKNKHLLNIMDNNNISSSDSESEYNINDDINTNNSRNNTNNSKENNSLTLEQYYHVSVNCHICTKHFSDIYIYRDHLKDHFEIDPTKQWKKCDFGCSNNSNVNDFTFIGHIATHSGNKPFICDVILSNGKKCGAGLSRREYFKEHFKRHTNNNNIAIDHNNITTNIRPKKTRVKNKRTRRNLTQTNNSNSKQIRSNAIMGGKGSEPSEFEDNFHVSIDCHICKKHFKDWKKYRGHVEKHYNIDPTKEWKVCDFSHCNMPMFKDSIDFLAHIASRHTKQKPFHCDVVVDGVKCDSTICRRSDARSHWKRHYQKNKSNKCVKKKSKKKEVIIDFESSYYTNINCHICKKLFKSFSDYRIHMKEHYENDQNRTWLQCDFGCKIDRNRPLYSSSDSFINHIALHTKKYPFVCGMDGCNGVAGIKTDMKRHWNKYHSRIINKNMRNNKNKNISSDSESLSDEDSSSSGSESDNSYSSSQLGSDISSEEMSSEESEERNDNINICDDDNYIDSDTMEFERSWTFQMNCYICQKYFDNLNGFREHLQNHFNSNTNKSRNRKWLQCEFGCVNKKNSNRPASSSNANNFIAHIAMHTKQKPFKCNVVENGKKCTKESTTKCVISNHWKVNHKVRKKAK